MANMEILKEEHFNELFVEFSNHQALNIQNKIEDSGFCEVTQLVQELLWQIEYLERENTTLQSEFHCIKSEKNELKEETSALQAQIGRLQTKLQMMVIQSIPH